MDTSVLGSSLYLSVLLQVRTIIKNSFKEALSQNDILISPAAPSAAYKIGKYLHLFAFSLLCISARSVNCFILQVKRKTILWLCMQVTS